jgi:hypothetical protein
MKLRVLAAVAALVSAAVHFKLWTDPAIRDIHVIGPAFLLNTVAGIVIAVLLLTWRSWVPLFLVIGFGFSTLGAFVISATVGLFGVNESWTGGYVWVAAVSEVVAIVAGVMAAYSEGWVRSLLELQDRRSVGRSNLHR